MTSAPAPVAVPAETLPATGGPAGIGLLGVAAAASGLGLRRLTREERRDELADTVR